MKVISTVVNTAIFQTRQKDKKKSTRFLHVSSLIPRKRHDKIIETVHQLKVNGYDVSLEIGGDGDTATLRRLVQKLKAEGYISVFY